MIKKILVFGAGYVGSSLGILLSQKYEVVIIDINKDKVKKINNKQSPVEESNMQELLTDTNLNLSASFDFRSHIHDTDLVILSLPTNFNEQTKNFETSILESVLDELNQIKFSKTIVIKSTVNIGFTEKAKLNFQNLKIIFVPEFLREGQSIEDNINPTRIVIGEQSKDSQNIAEVFLNISKNSPKVLYMNSSEAESVKLFSNAYLAARVSFFNELDSFSLEKGFNTKNIINGISSDPRIGNFYNNPSFGYGGYCLPKDTKQLLNSYQNIPQEVFSAIVKSNEKRKQFISSKILSKNPRIIGVFRLVMKKDSDNFREAAILDIIEILKEAGKEIIIFEPLLTKDNKIFKVCNDLDVFKETADIIIANRMSDDLVDIEGKVFTRDLYWDN